MTLPGPPWAQAYEVVVDTGLTAEGSDVAGSLKLVDRSLVLLRVAQP